MSHAALNLPAAILTLLAIIGEVSPMTAMAQPPVIPYSLKSWQNWATWDVRNLDSPSTFNSADQRITFWPSQFSMSVNADNGKWTLLVKVFSESWVPLPGGVDAWPLNVAANEHPIAVVQRDDRPALQLQAGQYELSGEFKWHQIPQKISIPTEIGLLSLDVDGKRLPQPSWDSDGNVWLKRIRTDDSEKNLLNVRVYRVLEDGIPMWLRTEIELIVSGESREEQLGWILPTGWKLVTIESPLPVAVDDRGQMKAQVRSGNWTINVDAFRPDDVREISFGDDTKPIVNPELVGFRAKPEFRMAELSGLPAIDVTQTTFPERWRTMPVYRWDTTSKIRLEEKTRGMGLQRPQGLAINRRIWLDEDGLGVTYRDSLTGQMQQIWRLDTATGQQLGSVRIDGESQLISANPTTGSHGVEVRTRNLNLDAIGRIPNAFSIPATGWQSDADSLNITLNLPPGWRLFALFGADSVQGDWLTAWSLLDLFLLLIFSLSVFRIRGKAAGVVAFLAFGLAYHEPHFPRLTWLFLLIPVALMNVISEGTAKQWVCGWKRLAIVVLLINLVPFLTRQIQTALYPQLERAGINYQPRPMFGILGDTYRKSASVADWTFEDQTSLQNTRLTAGTQPSIEHPKVDSLNLWYDPLTRIQTGPAQPNWSWNTAHCTWDGPVTTDQQIRPILISHNQHFLLTVARIGLVALLAAILLGAVRRPKTFWLRHKASAAMLVFLCCECNNLNAQEFPDASLLQTLRERLLKTPDAFPHAAEIPAVELKLDGNRSVMNAEIHAALEVAVPLPGRLPTWSPVSVSINGEPTKLICRRDNYLWTVIPQGVHHVVVESILPDTADWEWTFLLKPRTVSIAAPGWSVAGVGPNGVPEQQVFFTRKRKQIADAAAYDRSDFNAVIVIDRHLETGLAWQVRNEVTRLSEGNKAVSIKVPLLSKESVLTPGAIATDGFIEVRLGATQKTYSWTSALPAGADIHLFAADTDEWIERWHLVASPVWNVTFSGLAPTFEPLERHLIPVWHPWPSEKVSLVFHRPSAIAGDTITIQRVRHETAIGSRQRTNDLKIDLECSLGSDFPVVLNSAAEITSIKVGTQSVSVRRKGDTVMIPVQPGQQNVELTWRSNTALQTLINSERIRLPSEVANITSIVQIPESRWVLWTSGPTLGPAVQFWVILVSAVLGGAILGSVPTSPLTKTEWSLLAVGLTQVHIAAALLVVGWLFLLAWRGKSDPESSRWWLFNIRQMGLILLTLTSLGILVVLVGAGLLGHPRMFIVGNGSTQTWLHWYQARIATTLPETKIISISVWFYRLSMLLWALWLASALLRWLTNGWKQFSHGGGWKHRPVIARVSNTAIGKER